MRYRWSREGPVLTILNSGGVRLWRSQWGWGDRTHYDINNYSYLSEFSMEKVAKLLLHPEDGLVFVDNRVNQRQTLGPR